MGDPYTQVALVIIALLAGVGITAIGPGGIFLTISLYALLPITPPVIAGTASATFIATGLVGTYIYARSGQLTAGPNRLLAVLLSGASIAGALAGAAINPLVSKALFGGLLGVMAIAAGVLIVVQQARGLTPKAELDPGTTRGQVITVGIGLGIGLAGALLGVGGPVLAVPALVVLGVPMLIAVAVAQVQSVFVSGFATIGYMFQGAVSWPLALLVGVPQLLGVLAGWWIALRTEPRKLKFILGGVLVAVGIYLILRG
ncbi:MAG TPA: sulfite exporter TauE/SafE family protein [Longimicrobiales bacterium]|nr:sulfite exporter TauE/SafE family protein [Longimicrobiales bacterium]